MPDYRNQLADEAQYGAIPFDIFALENWKYDEEACRDTEQWNQLTAEYLALLPYKRQSYHDQARRVRDSHDDWSHPLLTPNNIARVLKPFQRIAERNTCALSTPGDPSWVRTCYSEELRDKYAALEQSAEVPSQMTVDDVMVLDDRDTLAIYDDDMEKIRNLITQRMPGLFDGSTGEDVAGSGQRKQSEATDSPPRDIVSLSNRMETYVYIADKDAIAESIVKIMWFDIHGQCLLVSKIDPDELSGMRGMFSDGYTMQEALEEKCLEPSDGEGYFYGESEEEEDDDDDVDVE